MYLTGNDIRQEEKFNLGWFFYHGESAPEQPGSLNLNGYRGVKLPHDWSLDYPFHETAESCGSGGYVETGIGWYKKLFAVKEEALQNRRVYISFEGAYMRACVWLNGEYLGEHIYGYTPFEWDVTELLEGGADAVNVLDVRIDNSAQPNSRWYSGSGITRNVWIRSVGETHVKTNGIYVRQEKVTKTEAILSIETDITAGSPVKIEHTILCPDGSAAAVCVCEEVKGHGDAKAIVSGPKLWSPDEPALYCVITRLYDGTGNMLDEVRTRIGLRQAVFDCDQGFLLNGEPVKINGVCLHHDGGCVGAAVPRQIWKRRLERLKAMGANGIRMSHNPPDPGLLDLCDELGFLVMDESFDEWRILKGKELGSNTHESRGYSEWFERCHKEDLEAMLRRDRNHPCIVIWSIGNEVPDQTDPNGHLTARHLKEICRRLAPDRPVTAANDQICAEPRAARQEFLDELDVVGYNYVDRWRTRAENFYDDDKRADPKRCMIGTEHRSCGDVRDEYPLPGEMGWWRQPYYSMPVTVGKLLKFTMTHDYVAGDFMWTGIDYLGEAQWPNRSSSAGVMDTCGFEKYGYYFYQSIWQRKDAMAHLIPHWNLDVPEGSIVPVLGFTNCESAELILNGKSYGRKAGTYPSYGMTQRYGHFDRELIAVNTDDMFLSWDVPYEPGCIELIGYRQGEEVCRHTVHTAGEPYALKASVYQKYAAADGLDVGQIEVEVVDARGFWCPQADCEILFETDGPAEVIGVDNGRPDSHESLRADRIRAFHGRAFTVIRSGGEAGRCTVKIYAAGLQSDSVEIIFE